MLPKTKQTKAARTEAGQSAVVRVVAGSLVLYAVLGTFVFQPSPTLAAALNVSPAVSRQETKRSAKAPARPVNLRVFRPLLEEARRMYERGALDLSSPLEVTIEGDIDEGGMLRRTEVSQDAQLSKLTDEFVRQLNASGVLQRLEGARRLALNFRLDRERVSARALAETDTDARAAGMAGSYNNLLALGRILRSGRREAVVLNNMTVTSSGKQLVLKLEMSRAALGNLLLKQVTPN
ncbi:MAG TPA: hypothetical protein VGB73_20725 [Pyrinomonadaceae bacterium]|jgi:hypothetical protein